MKQIIGQDLSKSVELDLIPGVHIPRGIYQVNIQWVSAAPNGMTAYNNSTFMTDSRNRFPVVVGKDVYSIEYTIHCHNSFPTNPMFYCRVSMRIDHLILLNLALKLIKNPLVGP
jgi:hypothetical protein